jgi:hypothetical protein
MEAKVPRFEIDYRLGGGMERPVFESSGKKRVEMDLEDCREGNLHPMSDQGVRTKGTSMAES